MTRIRPQDQPLFEEIIAFLVRYKSESQLMPGLNTDVRLHTFANQIVDSCRRVRYVYSLRNRIIYPEIVDPSNINFDPIKAAFWHNRNGNYDEACWIVFLATHFGKNSKSNWSRMRDVYNGIGNVTHWNWRAVSNNPLEFRRWLIENRLSISGGFGNHRKYESLKDKGTGRTIETYVDWIGAERSHESKFSETLAPIEGDQFEGFKVLYKSMTAVHSFGRTAKFDYLSMLGKMHLLNIQPDSVYLSGATGPYDGARIIFGTISDRKQLESLLDRLAFTLSNELSIDFAIQIIEDAVCNWQKNTDQYQYFGG